MFRANCQIRTDVPFQVWVTKPVQSTTMRNWRGEGQVIYTFKGLPQTLCVRAGEGTRTLNPQIGNLTL